MVAFFAFFTETKLMKKVLFFLSLFCVCILCASCTVEEESTEEGIVASIKAPEHTIADSAIILSPSHNGINSFLYLNMFRYEVDSAGKQKDTKTAPLNIGQIVPYTNTDGGSTFNGQTAFTDFFTTSGTYYKYFVRYALSGNKYVYSETTGIVTGVGGGEASVTGSATISFSKTDYTLSLNTDTLNISNMDALSGGKADTFPLHIVLQKGEDKNAIATLPLTKNGDTSYVLDLLSRVFPDDFYGETITIAALVGKYEKEETETTDSSKDGTSVKYTVFYKTAPLTSGITLTDKDEEKEIPSFTIEKKADSSLIDDFTTADIPRSPS